MRTQQLFLKYGFTSYTIFEDFPASFNFRSQRCEKIGTRAKVFMQTLHLEMFLISRSQKAYLSCWRPVLLVISFPPNNR